MIEAGVPGYQATLWFAIMAPAGTPPDIIARLNRDINAVVAEPDVKKTLGSQFIYTQQSSPAEVRETIRADIEKWRALAVKAGVGAK